MLYFKSKLTVEFFCFRGVGFLRYFQLKQLPNFLLASPILSLALGSIIHYVKLQPEIFLSLGFRGSSEDKNSASMFSPMGADRRAKGSYSLKERTSTIQQGDFLKDKIVLELAQTANQFTCS